MPNLRSTSWSKLVDAATTTELSDEPLRSLSGHELVNLDRLLTQVAQDADEPAVYDAGIVYLTMRALRVGRERPLLQARPAHPAVARALLLLRESGATLSLSELAEGAGVAAPHLSRLLIEHTGRNFIDWRHRIRLERFMTGYRPGTPLLESALLAGYGSYARFNRIFKDVIGCAPSEWVKRADRDDTGADSDRHSRHEPAIYGLPAAPAIAAPQRWITLMRRNSPAIGALLGPDFLDRLLAPTTSQGVPVLRRAHDRLDTSLPRVERERLLAVLRSGDPHAERELSLLMKKHDFGEIYARIVHEFGLLAGHLFDAVAALVVVLWVAAGRGAIRVFARCRRCDCRFGMRWAVGFCTLTAARRRTHAVE